MQLPLLPACLALCLCAALAPRPAAAYLAFPEVQPDPESGKADCEYTCKAADYFGDGPHVTVDGGNNGTSLCFVRPGEHGDEGLFGTKGGGVSCHVVKPSDPATRYAETSGYLCVCQNVDGEGEADAVWAPFGSQLEGMYQVSQDASTPCRLLYEPTGEFFQGSLQISAENVAVCAVPVWTGSGWNTTSLTLDSTNNVEVLFAHV